MNSDLSIRQTLNALKISHEALRFYVGQGNLHCVQTKSGTFFKNKEVQKFLKRLNAKRKSNNDKREPSDESSLETDISKFAQSLAVTDDSQENAQYSDSSIDLINDMGFNPESNTSSPNASAPESSIDLAFDFNEVLNSDEDSEESNIESIEELFNDENKDS